MTTEKMQYLYLFLQLTYTDISISSNRMHIKVTLWEHQVTCTFWECAELKTCRWLGQHT